MHILPRNVLPAMLPLPWAGQAGATSTRVLPRPTGEEKEWEKGDGEMRDGGNNPHVERTAGLVAPEQSSAVAGEPQGWD